MNIASFDDLLAAARQQPDPQRLLFVFVGVEMPAQPSAEQQQRHAQKSGGYLSPLMCVDKQPSEVADFAALVEESRATGKEWDMVFAGGLGGRNGQPPTSQDIDSALKAMIESIQGGRIGHLLAFDKQGVPVQFL